MIRLPFFVPGIRSGSEIQAPCPALKLLPKLFDSPFLDQEGQAVLFAVPPGAMIPKQKGDLTAEFRRFLREKDRSAPARSMPWGG